jgi:hypothetical protein
MDFFNTCKDKEEAKKVYRNLCKHFHPDKGGDPELMRQLTEQYEKFIPKNENNNSTYSRTTSYGSFRPFTFSSTGTTSAPFDHHLQLEITKLRNIITQKEFHIDVLIKNNSLKEQNYKEVISNLSTQVINAYESCNLSRDQVEKMQLQIMRLKSNDFEKMTVFEFMKYRWSKKDDN